MYCIVLFQVEIQSSTFILINYYAPNKQVQQCDSQIVYWVSQKMYLTLTLNFEAVTTLMSGILGNPVSLDLYNPFHTLFICFHGLMNKL